MTRSHSAIAVLLLGGLLSLPACSPVDSRASFPQVRRNVQERLNQSVCWNNGSEDDRRAEEAVTKLLADPLTVEATVQVALLNNRRVQAMCEDLGVAQADLVQAGLLRNPVFDAAVRFPLAGGGAEIDLGLAQDFLDVLLIPMRRKIAEAELQAAVRRVTAGVLRLASETESTFHEHQADLQLVDLHRQVLDAVAASAEAAAKLHQAGNISELDFAIQRTQVGQARIELATAEAEADQSRERLNALMGLWRPDTTWTVAARLPDLPETDADLAGVERRVIEASLDLAAARDGLDALAQRLGLTRAAAIVPELEAGVSAERKDGDWDLGPSISAAIPVFDLGKARLSRAQGEIRRAADSYYAQAVELRSRARAARLRLQASRSLAAFYRDDVLPLRQTIVDKMQLQYNGMQIGVFQLLQARQQQIDAGRRYVLALRDYWLAHDDLQALLRGAASDREPGVGSAVASISASSALGGH